MKYIHYFETEPEYSQARDNNYIEPWVSYTDGKGLDYNKPYDQYIHMPFTIEALSSGNITWSLQNKTVQYSKNGGTWETMNNNTTISVTDGDEIQFKGTNKYYDYEDGGCSIASTASFNVKGNAMSLTNGDNFESVTNIESCALGYILYSCTNLISAENLRLPATTLAESCYYNMFTGCRNLIHAPELPATVLATRCYSYMFYNCSSLTSAPELPATTLANYCYDYMFSGCSSLTSAPELPATTLAPYCYNYMFEYCSGITSTSELPATTLAEYCYCNMFNRCTSLTSAPELPATTLVKGCYNAMFRECTNINYVKAMFTTDPHTYDNVGKALYTYCWLYHVSSTGTFVKNSSAIWTLNNEDGIPSGWTVQTATE